MASGRATETRRIARYANFGRLAVTLELRSDLETRDQNHHVNSDENDDEPKAGYGPANLDVYAVGSKGVNYSNRYQDLAYWEIRGREQQLIDKYGGSKSDEGTSGNTIRGVGKDNINGRAFHVAASMRWGELSPYTGN